MSGKMLLLQKIYYSKYKKKEIFSPILNLVQSDFRIEDLWRQFPPRTFIHANELERDGFGLDLVGRDQVQAAGGDRCIRGLRQVCK